MTSRLPLGNLSGVVLKLGRGKEMPWVRDWAMKEGYRRGYGLEAHQAEFLHLWGIHPLTQEVGRSLRWTSCHGARRDLLHE